MIQAVVGMWRKVGIDANIEVYEIAKHFELRARHELAPAAFYNWGNSIGDPSTSTGFAMFGPSPHSAWKTEDVDKMIGPLWGEKDEAKRIAGYKAVDRYIAEQGYVHPAAAVQAAGRVSQGREVHAAYGGVHSAAERFAGCGKASTHPTTETQRAQRNAEKSIESRISGAHGQRCAGYGHDGGHLGMHRLLARHLPSMTILCCVLCASVLGLSALDVIPPTS